MKLAIINDTHFAHHNASEVFLDYTERFFSEVFFPRCEQDGIKQILHLGDFFDNRKVVNVMGIHRARKMFVEPMRDLGMTMDLVLGNHDAYARESIRVNSPKELLGFFINSVNIIERPSVLTYGSAKVGLVPWICNANREECSRFISSVECDVLAGHFEVKGFEMQMGVKSDFGLDPTTFERFPLVLSGHYHTRSSIGNITYLGTQYEMTWADCSDDKYFHVFDTETRTIQSVRNPLTIFKKIPYDDVDHDYDGIDVTDLSGHFVKIVVVRKNDPDQLTRLLDRIVQAGALEVKVSESFEEFNSVRLADDSKATANTPALIDGYVDAAETDLDKGMLKGLMRELYAEAQEKELVE